MTTIFNLLPYIAILIIVIGTIATRSLMRFERTDNEIDLLKIEVQRLREENAKLTKTIKNI